MKRLRTAALALAFIFLCGCSTTRITSTSSVPKLPSTVDNFQQIYNSQALGAKIDHFSKSLSNGKTSLSFTDSSLNMISLDARDDGSNISEIDVTTTNVTSISHMINPDFSPIVQTIMFICTPKENSANLLKELGIIGEYSGNKSVECDGIKYTFWMITSSDSNAAYFTATYPKS